MSCITSSPFSIFSIIRWGKGIVPTVKYVGRGIVMLPARRLDTASSSPANRFPETRARENLFLACKVEILVNAGCN